VVVVGVVVGLEVTRLGFCSTRIEMGAMSGCEWTHTSVHSVCTTTIHVPTNNFFRKANGLNEIITSSPPAIRALGVCANKIDVVRLTFFKIATALHIRCVSYYS